MKPNNRFCSLRIELTSSSDRNDALSSRGYGESRRIYSSRLDRDDATDYKKVCVVWLPWRQRLVWSGFDLKRGVCGCVQLYEQILAENEKLKAQLRDTDLELADLKLQLEKATQVR